MLHVYSTYIHDLAVGIFLLVHGGVLVGTTNVGGGVASMLVEREKVMVVGSLLLLYVCICVCVLLGNGEEEGCKEER
jgi:predicted alpha/beta-hydrolase family hydrolase